MNHTTVVRSDHRIVSVDILRATAIFLMIFCHCGIYLVSEKENPGFYFFANHVIGDFPAPVFLFLVGMGQTLSKKGGNFIKGFCLFLLSFLLSFLNSGTEYVFEWDVLSIIGVSMMALAFLKNTRSIFLILIASCIVLVAPWLRDFSTLLNHYNGFEWNVYLQNHGLHLLVDPAQEYTPLFSWTSIFNGFLWAGTFPVFPCLAYALIGFATGKVFFGSKQKKIVADVLVSFGVLLIAGSVLIAHAALTKEAVSVVSDFISAYSFYPLSFSLFLLQMGFVLVAFGILSNAFDKPFAKIPAWLERASRYSLSIYFLHYLILFWPIRLVGLVLKKDTDAFLSNATSWPVAMAVATTMVLFFVFLTKQWDRFGGQYSLEWFLTKARKISLSNNPYKAASSATDQ